MDLALTSVAETYKYIKEFQFEPGDGFNPYDQVMFSDSDLIRLSPKDWQIKLKRQSDGKFSNADDIWARTRITTPKACRKLLMLQVLPNHQPDDTEVNVRIYNGTDDYWWDGGAWAVAGPGEWNTEAEINANIDTFPILPNRTFAVTLNLKTTDTRQELTPTVREVLVLMEVHIDFLEDIVFRSILPALEAGVRPTSNYAGVMPFATDVSSIDLNGSRINTAFNIVDVERVYDLTDDVELLTNLRSGYDTGTKVISLSPDLPAGHRPLIVFRYQPEIVFVTHQDWREVAKVPALVIQRLEVPVATAYNRGAREGIVDKGTGAAVLLKEPMRANLEFRIHGITDSSVDEIRLMSQVLEFFDNNDVIASTGLDDYYRVEIDREFRDLSDPDRADNRLFWTLFTVHDFRMPFVSEDAYAVQKVILTMQEPQPPHEDPIKGGERVVATTHDDDSPVAWSETVETT